MTQQKYLDNQGKVGILEVTATDENHADAAGLARSSRKRRMRQWDGA